MCTQYFRDDLTLVLEDAQFLILFQNHPQRYEKLIFMHGSRALIGGCVFIYSGSARLISLKSTVFQKKLVGQNLNI